MNYKVGTKGYFSKTITETEVYTFAGISGDYNSMHVNRGEAEKVSLENKSHMGCW